MASSVFFRFKSQKEPTRVTFDGTGISVFELKREIISISRLGDGTDFELVLYAPDMNEEYDDDTTIIPRSTTVIARRLPAAKPGKGGAARYVSGKMPVNAKSTSRVESSKANIKGATAITNGTGVSELQSEEERMAAILQMGADQWQQQKAQMANATPVLRPGAKGKPTNIPDHPPPAGYTCHRCLQKGHWIQACPTNDDPNFEGRPRIKRTTGIPKSFLRTVEKPTSGADGSGDEQKVPSGVMVNAEGEYVVAEPDKASWEQYQAKANRSALAQQEAAVGSKELQDRGLECSIDKRMFVDPVKTPCCQTTYCNDCITTALLDDNLQCPNCGKEGVSIDDLVSDEEMMAKLRSYKDEKAEAAKAAEEAKKITEEQKTDNEDHEQPDSQEKDISRSRSRTKSPAQVSENNDPGSPRSKKRKAEDLLESDRKTPTAPTENGTVDKTFPKQPPKGPKADAQKGSQFPPELAFMNSPAFMNGGNLMPGMNMFPNMPMNMPMNMNMNMNAMNPMMMPNNPMWQQMMMSGMNGMNGMNSMNGINGMNGMNGTGNWGGNQFMNQSNFMNGQGGSNMNNRNFNGPQRTFNNRQPTEDSPYFRQPVNPQRHQGRRNVQRPADYREI